MTRLIAVGFCAGAFLACSPGWSSGPADGGPSLDAGLPYEPMPIIADLPNGWTEINPGGETTCSRGQPWGFFVRPGTVNKVILEFQGGGACWNKGTCSFADAIFKDNIDDIRQAVVAGHSAGLTDHENEANPVRDWTHVYIPYCTGDIHWGHNRIVYGDGEPGAVELHHRGAINGMAALRWLTDNVVQPETVLATGCSAGSYGSIGWTPHLAKAYPEARIVQFGDCGAGIITDTFLRDSFPSWQADWFMPAWIDSLDPEQVDIGSLNLADLYRRIGAFYPNVLLAQFNTVLDENQAFYFDAMGGTGGAEAWSDKMRASIYDISQNTPSFKYFIADGERHCIVPRNQFYSVETRGVLLLDWLSALLAGEAVDNVACEGCEPQPLEP
jgi:hypothetical protein